MQLTDERLVEELLPTVRDLLGNPERLAAMGAAARSLDKPQAALNLARLLATIATETTTTETTTTAETTTYD